MQHNKEVAPIIKLNVPAVKKLMAAEGVKNQAQLAKRLGVSRSMMTRLFTGGRSSPGAKVIMGFVREFPDYPLRDLIIDEEASASSDTEQAV